MIDGISSAIDIRHYINLILKRRHLAIAIFFLVVSLFTWGSFIMPKAYEASSTVVVERSSVMDPLIRGVGVSASMDDRLRNLRDGITSRNIVERVIKKLDLDTTARNAAKYETLIDATRKKIILTIRSAGGRGTDLFIISYIHSDPKIAQNLVNTLVSEYIEENVKFRRTDATGAFEFIATQLFEYKKKLEDSDRAIREFREKNPNMVPRNETAIMGRVEGFETARTEAEIRVKELSRRRESLQKQLSGEKELTVAFVTREGSPQARLSYLNNQLMLLTMKYTDNYPEVIKARHEIEEFKKQIAQTRESRTEGAGTETSAMNPMYQQLKEELSRTDAEVESLMARIGELSRQHGIAQNILGRMPKEQEDWTKLQRDRNVLQRIYDDLLQKLENARVSKDLEMADKNASFRVVDPAVLPLIPSKPNRLQLMLAGIFLGIAAGGAVAIGLEYMNKSFKDAAEIEARLAMPVFSLIPKISTEEDVIAIKRKDKKVFAAAAAYMAILVMVFAAEFVHRYMGIRIMPF